MHSSTRRRFLQRAALAGAAAVVPWQILGCSKTRSLRLLYFTDVHATPAWGAPEKLAQLQEMMRRTPADLVILGGDCVHGGFAARPAAMESAIGVFRQFSAGFGKSYHPAVGNHDLIGAQPNDSQPAESDPRAWFRSQFLVEQTYRTFTACGQHFIFLDPIEILPAPQRYRGFVGGAQMAWLQETLGRIPRGAPIILICHIPLITTFVMNTQGTTVAAPPNLVVENGREVLELFASYNLRLVLQGHLHYNEVIQARNTTFVMGGALCGRWWQGDNFGTQAGFGVATLELDRVRWDYQTLEKQS